jgi:uncharacterized membrane protein
MLSDNSDQNNLFFVSIAAGVIGLIGGVIQVTTMAKSVGILSFLEAVTITSPDKVNFALFLTFPFASLAIILWAGTSILKGYTKSGSMIAVLAVLTSIVTLILPSILGYPSSILGLGGIVLGAVLTGVVWFQGSKLKGVEVEKGPYLTPREIALLAIFSALTAVLTGSTGIMLPSPTGGYTHIGDTAIFIAALLFGSKMGGLVGIIGPVVADLMVGYPRWFVTVLAHGAQGFIAGLGKGRNTVVQVIILAFSGIVMATTYFFVNVFIKGYPLAIISYGRDLFGQVLVSLILCMIVVKGVEKALPSILK